MNIMLDPMEARVIGCLIEKAITTPDQYPLSINALTNACNQKSNRDPVLNLEEREVQAVVDGLLRKHLVLERSGFGSRVPKYQHRFCNTGFGALELSAQQTAIVCELLLRGPQTPGELRTRTARLATACDVSDIEAALAELAARDDGPLVMRLAREPGRRDARYAHLFGGSAASAAMSPAGESQTPDDAVPHGGGGTDEGEGGTAMSEHSERGSAGTRPTAAQAPGQQVDIASLLARVLRLEQHVVQLQAQLDDLREQRQLHPGTINSL
jgi:uncharacterized protein YceH (UPF0502 family)